MLKISRLFLGFTLFTFLLALGLLAFDFQWLSEKISIMTFVSYAIGIFGLSLYTFLAQDNSL